MALGGRDDGRAAGAPAELPGAFDVPCQELAGEALGHVHPATVGGEPDAVRAPQGVGRLDDARAVGLRVVEAPAVDLAGPLLAQVGEPEAARGVEHDVVRAVEAMAVAFGVEPGDGAGLEVDALDPTAPEVGWLVAAGLEVHRDGDAGALAPEEAAVVAHVDRTVGPDGRAVGPPAEVGDDLDVASGADPRERASFDLDDQHAAVCHGDRSLGELQSRGELAHLRHGDTF